MYRYPVECPTCGQPTIISEVSCTNCDTAIKGSYTGCTFCQLPDEDLRFLELFSASRGNVKEMERETGLSYWTIRGKVDDLIAALGLDSQPVDPQQQADERRRILGMVESGEISVAEAEQQLATLAKHPHRGKR